MLLSHFLKHATPEHALQLVRGGDWNNPVRVTTQAEVDQFVNANKDKDVYFNTALMAKPKGGRGASTDARFVPALFIDFDCAGGKHAGDRPTKGQVADMLKSGTVPLPSYVIDSGGGLHAYWLVDENDPAKVLPVLVSLNEHIFAWSKKNGWKYERLKDLARVLRVPGSHNQKYKDKPLVKEILTKPENVYPLSAFPKVAEKPDVGCSEFVDQDTARAAARVACADEPKEWANDGSKYLLYLCRHCVRHGCDLDSCVQVVRETLATCEGYPTKWSKEDIASRYKSAQEQTPLGEGFLPITDLDLAEYIAKQVKNEVCYVPKWKQWLAWNGQKFDEMSAIAILQRRITDISIDLRSRKPDDKEWAKFYSRFTTTKGMREMQSLLDHQVPVSHEDLDADPLKLCCLNGCLAFDLQGGFTFAPHSPANWNTKIAGVEYSPTARCPRWENFIKETFVHPDGTPDPELANYVQMLAGYCLTGRVDIQYLWVFSGDGGNGKSVFVDTILKMLGDYARTIDQDTFTGQGQSFGTTRLFRTRAAFASETDQDCRLNEHRVKNLTGGDSIAARDLYQSFWEFAPTHKLFLSTNYIPNIRGSDKGIWRRVKVVPFNNTPKDPDNTLANALAKELPGILNWAIVGYGLLQYGLTEPKQITLSVKECREESDILGRFIDEECERREDAFLAFSDFKVAFKYWCEKNGYYLMSDKAIGHRLEREFKKGKLQNKKGRFGLALKEFFLDEQK